MSESNVIENKDPSDNLDLSISGISDRADRSVGINHHHSINALICCQFWSITSHHRAARRNLPDAAIRGFTHFRQAV